MIRILVMFLSPLHIFLIPRLFETYINVFERKIVKLGKYFKHLKQEARLEGNISALSNTKLFEI